jgi:hypothetical protein
MAFLATLGNQDVTPNAVNWANISSASSPAANANQTVNGCSRSITISAANSGSGFLEYRLDSGSYVIYSAPFSVNALAGQTLNWRISAFAGTVTGTITVTNDSDASTTLDTFTYDVTDPI